MDVFNVFRFIFLGILLFFNVVEGGNINGCYSGYQQCYDTNKQVPRPGSLTADWTTFCNAADTLDNCLKNDVTSCGTNVVKPQAYTDYVAFAADIKKSCNVVNCATKSKKCTASLAANPKCTDLSKLASLPLADGVNCCKIGATTTKCLRDCGDNNIISSDPVLQRSDELCRGYNDYCPEMYDCFENNDFNGPAAVCSNVGDFITCIEKKCANKPQIGQQTLTKIREVFNEICQVVSKYPAIASCSEFTSCIDKAPSLPGIAVGKIPSFISARDTDRWCQIAKSYVGCGVTAADSKSCNPGAGFTSAVSTVQTSINQACTGVRGPCPAVYDCLATLAGSQTELKLKTTCPNIPAFVTCTENALTKCGEGSRVKADYSLVKIRDLFVETCAAMTDELYQCSLMNTCLDLQLPLIFGDQIDEFSDQTSWCRKLNRMLKCTADVSTPCRQSKAVHDKFVVLYDKVRKLCTVSDLPLPTDSGTSTTRVTGVLVMTVFLVIFI